MDVRLALADDPTLAAQRLLDRRPRLEPVQPVERCSGTDDIAALAENRDGRQSVSAADLEVVGIVRGRHLDGAGPERRVDVLVGHDGDLPAHQRQLDGGADQVGVSLVVRMDRDAGVAQHRLHPRGGDDNAVVTITVDIPITDRDQLTLVVGVVHLDVGQRRHAARAPVDDPFGPVDQSVVEHLLEDGLHRGGQAVVQGEPLAAPVDGIAEPLHLAEDRAAGLVLPVPDLLDEQFTAEVVPGLAVDSELLLDHVLGGDARVIHAGEPQHLVTGHPAPASKHIHQGLIQRVPDVQISGDVRRRQHDRERPALAG